VRRAISVLVLSAVAVIVGAAVAVASAAPISVTPAKGRPKTKFTVSFRAPASAGARAGLWTQYAVEANGRAGRHGCVSQTSVAIGHASAGSRVRVKLSPAARNGWCKDTFRGRIEETQRPICSPHLLCPMFIVLVRQVGTFTFRVR
jgi:hypothetical protein